MNPDSTKALNSVELIQTDGIATIFLNRPDKRNAITDTMRAELVEVLRHVGSDDSVRAVVLSGRGKGFCAGGDITGMQARLDAPVTEAGFRGWRRQQGVHHAVSLLHNMPKPTIAAVNGAAAGLGADMAMSCDFVIASSEYASFAWSYIARGLVPDGGGLYFLPRRVGLPLAKDLIFSGRTVRAEEAERIGLVDRVSAAATLLDDAATWARELSTGSATAIALGKTILNQSFELTAQQVMAQGSQAQGICYTSSEHRASVAAFLARQADKGNAQ